MEFVGALWKTKDLQERLQEAMDLEESGVAFHWLVLTVEIW